MSFQNRLSSGEFVILAQMNTPKGVNISELVNNARRIKERVHGVIIPDMDNGVMRMSAIAGGVLMRQQGVEPIIHVYGRDKNRMALQGDISGRLCSGIQNLVVVRGEDMPLGDHVEAKPVDDLDEVGLLSVIRSLEKGKDAAGFELDGTPSFTVGCAIGPYSDERAMDEELEKARVKVEAGAGFMIALQCLTWSDSPTLRQRRSSWEFPSSPQFFC
jgi:methylenetetrahydrofolate reductase (NADPH)